MTAEPVLASIRIDAPPHVVFPYFTDREALLTWMGDAVTLDPRPGGRFAVDVRGVAVRGEYLVVEPPHRVVFTWGHAGSDRLPPGASRVEVRLVSDDGATRVDLVHHGLPDTMSAGHGRGWIRFLSRLATGAGPRCAMADAAAARRSTETSTAVDQTRARRKISTQ